MRVFLHIDSFINKSTIEDFIFTIATEEMNSSMGQAEEEEILLFNSRIQEAGEKRRRRRKGKAVDNDGTGGRECKKRRLTDVQVKFLETNFGEERKLEYERKVHLATELGLDPKQVAVWFQNRRARLKSKTIEEEYVKLKNQHDESIVDKCRLENEVMKLKKRIMEAEEEIKRLSGCVNEGSPSSSSTDNYHHIPLGNHFGGDLVYGYDQYNDLRDYLMDWGYLL